MSKNRILIVDDEIDLTEILKDDLQELNCEIVIAYDGAQALSLIIKSEDGQPFDAVLSDLNMPKMNGLELIQAVRMQGIEVPFVFLTGYADKENAVRALKFGAFDFLEKPYNLEDLAKVTSEAVSLGSTLRTVNSEIEQLAKARGIPSADLAAFKEAQRALMLLKKSRAATIKKVS